MVWMEMAAITLPTLYIRVGSGERSLEMYSVRLDCTEYRVQLKDGNLKIYHASRIILSD